MSKYKAVAVGTAAALMTHNASAKASSNGEVTVTGVISNVNPDTRIATLTPLNGGKPVVVQFSFNVGGPCRVCLGGGLKGPIFDQNVTNGSVWSVTYTSSYPPGEAKWFPGGTVHTVYRARKLNAAQSQTTPHQNQDDDHPTLN